MLCQDALTYWKYNCKEEHCDTEVYKRLQDEFGERAVGYSNGAEPTSAANKFCEVIVSSSLITGTVVELASWLTGWLVVAEAGL